jgi:hypothetical protein
MPVMMKIRGRMPTVDGTIRCASTVISTTATIGRNRWAAMLMAFISATS